VQVVVYLRPTKSEFVTQTIFTANNLRHEFQVLRLWEQPTALFLERPGLLPYAVLSQTTDPVGVLQQVAATIESLSDPAQQSNLAAAAGILSGLVLDKQVIRRLLRRELMRESVIYQELQAEARSEAQQAERSLVLRQLQRRVGTVPTALQEQVNALALSDLEDLGEALLDFTTLGDLEAWLQTHATD